MSAGTAMSLEVATFGGASLCYGVVLLSAVVVWRKNMAPSLAPGMGGCDGSFVGGSGGGGFFYL